MAAHDHIGGFAVPSDITGYTEVVPTYQAGTSPNLLGTELGLSPTFTGFDPIEADETGWVGPKAEEPPAIPPGSQAKFRITLSGSSHFLYDDPIRNFGHPGASHLHMFYGNKGVNAHSTFASLRTRNASGSAGGPMNATPYWIPAIRVDNAFGDGKNYALPSTRHILYYNDNDVTETHKLSLIVPGLRYVFGQNMDDPAETYLDDLIATANAQPGTAGRYRKWATPRSGLMDHFRPNGWKMFTPDGSTVIPTGPNADQPNDTHSYGFTNLDGSDPWEGAGEPALHGGQNCLMVANVAGPHYWDGVNPWSPGGYKHMMVGIYDTVVGDYVPPHGWFRLPALEQQIMFTHRGWEDYRRWYLDSDAHYEMLLGSPIPPGFSLHGDWFGAWQNRVLLAWQTVCSGVGNNAPHECDASQFSLTEGLQVTGHVVDNVADTSSPDRMHLIPSTGTGKGPIITRTRHT